MDITKHQQGNLIYYQKGDNPALLLLSGMHGDEYEVIRCVKQYIQNNRERLPYFLYIPEISPSAVSIKTRRNIYNHDVNRQFVDPPTDPEVKAFMELVSPHHFSLSINFHEDPDLTSTFYLYDSGSLNDDQLLQLRSQAIEAGAGLHSGKDDPLDAHLGLYVEKGYISTPYESLPEDAGFSWLWYAKHGITKRSVDIEIPGKAPLELKNRLVELIFSFFLTPEFGF